MCRFTVGITKQAGPSTMTRTALPSQCNSSCPQQSFYNPYFLPQKGHIPYFHIGQQNACPTSDSAIQYPSMAQQVIEAAAELNTTGLLPRWSEKWTEFRDHSTLSNNIS